MPKLKYTLQKAETDIETQLFKADEIRNRKFVLEEEIDRAFDDTKLWTDYTHALLIHMFDSDEIADEFSDWKKVGYDKDICNTHMNPTLEQQIDFFYYNIDQKINRLKSIYERLKFYVDNGNVANTKVLPGFRNINFNYDVFICHASEDKASAAKPLADSLIEKGVNVWYDDFNLTIGDSLRQKIDEGLKQSRFGIVILSPSFFNKKWPQHELDGLTAKEMQGDKVILPVWHNITEVDVSNYSLTLAGRMAGNTKDINDLVNKIMKVLESKPQAQSANSKSDSTDNQGKINYWKEQILLLAFQSQGVQIITSLVRPIFVCVPATTHLIQDDELTRLIKLKAIKELMIEGYLEPNIDPICKGTYRLTLEGYERASKIK